MRRTGGFSLIEIAIVLAVIALLAAAVLMGGGSLFGRSGMTTLLSSVKDLSTASREFKVRYGYFPGDLPNAKMYIKGAEEVSDGCNHTPGGTFGDGIVNTPTESNCALEHLVKAGMLRGIDYDAAAGRYVIAINNWGTGTRVSLWRDPATNTNAVRVWGEDQPGMGLPCEVALEIKRRLDNVTSSDKPFAGGSVVKAFNSANTPIETCTPGNPAGNDPVATLLIRY